MTIHKVLNNIGGDIITNIQGKLQKDYRIYDKFRTDIVQNENKIELNIITEDYFKWIDKGRGPGKMPPHQPIADWVERKGIPTEAIFPIRRKIGKFGIPPKMITESIMELSRTSFSNQIKEWGFEYYSNDILSFFNPDK